MIYLIIWIVCGIIAGAVYSNRGRSGISGFLIGVLLGPLGIILALVSKPNTQELESRSLASGDLKKCPNCAELVRGDARVCKHCGREFTGPAVQASLSYQHLRTDTPKKAQPYVKITATGGACSACGEAVERGAAQCPACRAMFATGGQS